MIRVNLVKIGTTGKECNSVIELAQVPRIGDYICLNSGDPPMEIRTVIWNAFASRDYDVQVRFR